MGPQAPEVRLSHCFICRDPLFWLELEFRGSTRNKSLKDNNKNKEMGSVLCDYMWLRYAFLSKSPNIAARCVTPLLSITFTAGGREWDSLLGMTSAGRCRHCPTWGRAGWRESRRNWGQERWGWCTDAGECTEGNGVNYSTGFPYRKWHRAHSPN